MTQHASGSTGSTNGSSAGVSDIIPTGLDTMPDRMPPASSQQSEQIAISPPGILQVNVSQTQEFADTCSPKESIPHAVDSNCVDFDIKSPRFFWIFVQALVALSAVPFRSFSVTPCLLLS